MTDERYLYDLFSNNVAFNLIGVIGHVSYLTPFPSKPLFLRICSTILLKNTVKKGEIACNEQFLLFPLCFLSK